VPCSACGCEHAYLASCCSLVVVPNRPTWHMHDWPTIWTTWLRADGWHALPNFRDPLAYQSLLRVPAGPMATSRSTEEGIARIGPTVRNACSRACKATIVAWATPLPWTWLAVHIDSGFARHAFETWWQLRVLVTAFPRRRCPGCQQESLTRSHLQLMCPTCACSRSKPLHSGGQLLVHRGFAGHSFLGRCGRNRRGSIAGQ